MTAGTSHLIDRRRLIEQTERVCIALLRTDIDLAFTFLRLARTEFKFGATRHATELIEKAVVAHKSVMKHVNRVPPRFDQERRVLEYGARKLLEAITATEQQFHLLSAHNSTTD